MNEHKSQLISERKPATAGLARKVLGTSQVGLTDPDPPDDSIATWEAATRFAILGIGLVVVIFALYVARSILMPVCAALLIGITMRPIQIHLSRFGVPASVTALLLVGVFIAGVYYMVTLVAGSLTEWLAQAPDLGNLLREKLRWVEGPMSALRNLQKEMGGGEGKEAAQVAVGSNIPALLQGAVVVLTPAVSELLLFIGTLLFFLVGTEKLRRQLITLFETRDARLTVVRIWNDIEQNLVAFVATVTFINIGLGALTALMLYLLGFPNPIAFGVLAFVLNYIPYIGPTILVAILFLVGLIATPSFGSAVLPPLVFVGMATLEGHLITPSIVGRRLTLSPFLVFLALAFWTWLWGPLGAFLATPLLIVGLVALGHMFPRDEVVLPK